MKDEKTKILDGTYSSRIDTRKQAKHIYNSDAFKRETAANLLKKQTAMTIFCRHILTLTKICKIWLTRTKELVLFMSTRVLFIRERIYKWIGLLGKHGIN